MRSARASIGVGILAALCAVIAYWWIPTNAKEPVDQSNIPVAKVADYVHSVIEANRTFYTIHVVERMQRRGVVARPENWRVTNTLPLPAEFLKEWADLATKTGTKIDYRLISLWPINKENGPAEQLEQAGLNDVLAPARNAPIPERSHAAETGIFARSMPTELSPRLASAAITPTPTAPKGTSRRMMLWAGYVISIPLGQ